MMRFLVPSLVAAYLLCPAAISFGQTSANNPSPAIPRSKAGPDLIISALKAYRNGEDRVDYEWIITNIGKESIHLDGKTDEDHDNLCVQAFMSKDTTFDPKDDVPAGGTIVGSSPLGKLEPGESMMGKFSCSLKRSIDEFPILTLKVDWHDAFEEANETNNFAAVGIGPAKEKFKKLKR